MVGKLTLLDLPDCMIDKIMLYLSYDEIANNRIVCRKFNEINQNLLNRGFHKMRKNNMELLQFVKSELPRRESEQSKHRFYKHYEFYNSLNSSILLLSMIFEVYINIGEICFIPGKIVDEYYRIVDLSFDEEEFKEIHNIDFMKEFRDLKSMAIEHFENEIEPAIKSRGINTTSAFFDICLRDRQAQTSTAPQNLQHSLSSIIDEPAKEKKSSKLIKLYKKQLKVNKKQSMQLKTQSKVIKKQSVVIKNQTKQMKKIMNFINKLKRRVDELE